MRNGVRVFAGYAIGLALLLGGNLVCAAGAQRQLDFHGLVGTGVGIDKKAHTDFAGAMGYRYNLDKTGTRDRAYIQGYFMARRLESSDESAALGHDGVSEDQGYDLDAASAWEVNNSLLVEPSDKLSMQWGAVARVLDFGRKGRAGNMLRWYSTGVRPIYYFTDRVNLATEFGVDYVDDDYRDLKGSVRKYTVALQLTNGRSYHKRPVVRLFFTKATWSEEFKGLVGGTAPGDAPYGGATEGWTAGVQLKASW